MKLKRLFFGSLSLSAVLAGCSINDYGDCRSSEFTLSLDVRVPAVSADAATKAAGHGTEKGNDAESAIDDIRIIVFDKNGAYLEAVAPESVTVSEESSDYTVYSLVGKLDPKKDENNLESFRVMVLANWACFDGSNYNGFGETDAKSIGEISGNGKDFNFTIKHKEEGSVKKTWTPSLSGNKTLIPMFGLSDNLKVDSFFADKDGVVRVDATISMLRALAKVEIVDATDDAISSVSLSSSNLNGRFIPAGIDGSAFNPDNIGSPSLPTTDIETVTDLSFVSAERKSDGIMVYTAYIPEMSMDSNRPDFSIKMGNTVKETPFDNYANGKVDESNHLADVVRNHIYRYTVTGSSVSLSVEMAVLPWDMTWDDEIHFDPPTIMEPKPDEVDPEDPYPYYLKWTTKKEDVDNPGNLVDNGYVDDPENMQLLMKPGTDDYAECTFTLAAPLNAKWIANIVSFQGKHDAFALHPDFSSGKIDGTTPAVVKIKNTSETVSDERNEARLVIMVEYPDKTQKEAIVVKPGSNTNNYVIVQQKTTIQ